MHIHTRTTGHAGCVCQSVQTVDYVQECGLHRSQSSVSYVLCVCVADTDHHGSCSAMKLIKDTHQATVTQDGDRIIKQFKPGYKFLLQDHAQWQHTLNQFSARHRHFPRVIECSEDSLIMARAPGHAVWSESLWHGKSIQEKIAQTQQLQLMYFTFVTHVLQHNIEHHTHIAHHDLNANNMFVHQDQLICIDLNAVTTDNPGEYYWIEFGAKEIAKRTNLLQRQQQQHQHRLTVAELQRQALQSKERLTRQIDKLQKQLRQSKK